MTDAGSLSALSTTELERLAAALRRGELDCPITRAGLAATQLQALDGRLSALDALPSSGVLAVLDAVLAERRANRRSPAQLIWTGPDIGAAVGRDTAVAVRELFARARREVLVCAYSIDHGADILEPLHEVMRDHAVAAQLFLHIERMWEPDFPEQRHVERAATRFLEHNWPFGPPFPALYYDPRTVAYGSIISLHAKCVVVDQRWTLVTSANFTDRGQTRNVEVGVVLDDPTYAQALTQQVQRLRKLDRFKPANAGGAAPKLPSTDNNH